MDRPEHSDGDPATLDELLDLIQPHPDDERLSIGDILSRIGRRSFMPVVLAIALLLVSPLSGIPGTPTIGAMLIVVVTVQAALGRDHVWLPRFIRRRQIAAHRIDQGVRWLRKPVQWLDRRSRDRLQMLTTPPLDRISHLAILAVTLPWPLLELLPMVTSAGALAVSLLAFALMVKDGLFVIGGFVYIATALLSGFGIWQGVT